MKKFILINIVILFCATSIYSQTCVNCDPNSNASGTNSTALGYSTTASGSASFAAGANSNASGAASFALGLWNISDDSYTTSIGSYAHATGNKSIVIGHGYGSNYYLTNSISYSLAIGFNSNIPTLFIGTSDGIGKTGSIGIGNMVDPEAKLHLFADEGELASMFIQPHSWYNGDPATILLGSKNTGFYADSVSGMYFLSEGNYLFNSGGFVGINTTKPEYNLHVNGGTFTTAFRLYDEHLPPKAGNVLVSDDLGNAFWVDPNEYSLWTLNENGTDIYRTDGNVGIGTINTYGYKLAVNGKIITEELMVKHPDNWPDYVFAENYNLMSLNELSAYIKDNSHLPEIPSTQTVEENGIEVGEMNGLLLKKIEELTLYIIEQQKQIDKMQQKIDNLVQ